MTKIMNNKGFTLIELVIVIVILGVLATLVGPKMVGTIRTSRINTVIANIGSVEKAAMKVYAETNAVPTLTTIEGNMDKTFANMGLAFGSASINASNQVVLIIYVDAAANATFADLTTGTPAPSAKLIGAIVTGPAGHVATYTVTLQ